MRVMEGGKKYPNVLKGAFDKKVGKIDLNLSFTRLKHEIILYT